jgi:hypothetical protein
LQPELGWNWVEFQKLKIPMYGAVLDRSITGLQPISYLTRLKFWVATSGYQPEITPTRLNFTTTLNIEGIEIFLD